MNGDTWVRIGAISAAIAVAAGAFGAHGLDGYLEKEVASGARTQAEADRALEVFGTGATYQMYHALAMIAVGLVVGPGGRGGTANLAGWSFLVGSLVFSGSLYALALSGLRWLGAITPIGGVACLAGWIALAIAARPPGR